MLVRRVGIALAAYRPQPAFLREQLASIQRQTFSSWSCLLSFDSPLAAVREEPALREFFEDPRFAWRENPERFGYRRNFEATIQALVSTGVDAVACCDQDDVWAPDKLARNVEALERSGPLSLVHSDMWLMTEDGIRTERAWAFEHRSTRSVTPSQLLVRNVVSGCSMLFDAELARRFPCPDEGVEHHDHWYALVASFYGGVHPIADRLLDYRQHADNAIGASRLGGPLRLPRELRTWPVRGAARSAVQRQCQAWQKVRALARAALYAGLPLDDLQKLSFISEHDRGAGLFALGLRELPRDLMVARDLWAHALGKLLSSTAPDTSSDAGGM